MSIGRRWTKWVLCAVQGLSQYQQTRLVSGGTPATTTHGNDRARRICEPAIGRDAMKRARSGGLMPIL
jgi:hypothetical protein